MPTLSDYRARVLYALGVTSSTERGFTDANIDEHIKRAVEEFSLYLPAEASADVNVGAGLRAFTTGGLVRPLRVLAVEYPLGQWPRALLDFDVWGSTVTLDHGPPAAAYAVRVYYAQQHLTDGSGSTVPAAYDTVVVEGATAFAILARTLGSAQTRESAAVAYQTYDHLRVAQARLRRWQEQLARLAAAVGRRAAYTPGASILRRDVVTWPN